MPFIRHFVLKMHRKIEVVVWDGIRQIDCVAGCRRGGDEKVGEGRDDYASKLPRKA